MSDVTGKQVFDARDGITIRLSVAISDFWRLGAWLAEQNSDDQAEFLHGLQTGFQEMGVVESYRQMGYIADSSAEFSLSELARLFYERLGSEAED